jgi:hypothetical protein
MTNTGHTNINQSRREGTPTMQGYIEITNTVIRARMRERQAEAAGERLAAAARSSTTGWSVRRNVGLLLIRAGQRVGGGQVTAGPSSARPAHRIAA